MSYSFITYAYCYRIFSYIIRAFSLAIRLSANIMAGHTLVFIISHLLLILYLMLNMAFFL